MNEEEPPPNEQPATKEKPLGWPFWLFLALLVAALATLTLPQVIRAPMKSEQAKAESNLGMVWYALIGFNEEYGCFPNEETATHVKKDFPTDIDLSGSSSNALFRQLFAAELTDTEQIFFARMPGVLKPDGIITSGEALKKGECSISYIAGLSSKDDLSSPIVLAPLIPGTTKFDPKPFDGKAVVLQIDKSVEVYEIQKDGHIYRDGIDLLSPKHPVWKGKAPDIRYPEL